MKKTKRTLCSVMAALTLLTGTAFAPEIRSYIKSEPVTIVQSVNANAASVVTGNFNYTNWTSYTNIYSKNTKKSKIKLCTFDLGGWRSGGTIDYEVYSNGKRVDYNFYGVRTATNITLPKGYENYKIRIRPHKYNSGARNFENNGRCVMWSIDSKSNCWL